MCDLETLPLFAQAQDLVGSATAMVNRFLQRPSKPAKARWEEIVHCLHQLPTEEYVSRQDLRKESIHQLKERLRQSHSTGKRKGPPPLEKEELIEAIAGQGGSSHD